MFVILYIRHGKEIEIYESNCFICCFLHLRKEKAKDGESDFWEHPIVAERNIEIAYYTLH